MNKHFATFLQKAPRPTSTSTSAQNPPSPNPPSTSIQKPPSPSTSLQEPPSSSSTSPSLPPVHPPTGNCPQNPLHVSSESEGEEVCVFPNIFVPVCTHEVIHFLLGMFTYLTVCENVKPLCIQLPSFIFQGCNFLAEFRRLRQEQDTAFAECLAVDKQRYYTCIFVSEWQILFSA